MRNKIRKGGERGVDLSSEERCHVWIVLVLVQNHLSEHVHDSFVFLHFFASQCVASWL